MSESVAKRPLSLTSHICLAAVSYTKIIDRRMLGRPIQVNRAFYSIKKSSVIKKCKILLTGQLKTFLGT